MTDSNEATSETGNPASRGTEPSTDGSPIGPFADSVIALKTAYPDMEEVTVDLLFLAFLLQFADFSVFSFGPVTIDVRLVERRFAQTYRRQDGPLSDVKPFDDGARRFYRTLAREVTNSTSRRPDELHFLLAFMRTPEGLPAAVFGELGVRPEDVEAFARSRALGPGASPSASAETVQPERLYSPEDAAEYLGVHVQSVRVWIRQGKIPARRILGQRALRIRESDLARVLEPLDGAT